MRDDDDPLWKRVLTSELLWTALAAIAIIALAFALATRKQGGAEGRVPLHLREFAEDCGPVSC